MPILVGCTSFPLGSGDESFSFPMHKHDDMTELLLIVEGAGRFVVDGVVYEAKPGDLLCYNQGVWHEEQSTSERFSALYVGFSGLQLKDMPSNHLTKKQQSLVELQEHYSLLRHTFSELIREASQGAPESDKVAELLLGALAARLVRLIHYPRETAPRRKRPGREAAAKAKRYMEENYNLEIHLEVLARHTHVDAYHLSHLFKQEVGVSPIQYLIGCRIDASKQYLATTTLPVSEIAVLVGYQSETYFQNLFKKVTGRTPGQYRAEMRERGSSGKGG